MVQKDLIEQIKVILFDYRENFFYFEDRLEDLMNLDLTRLTFADFRLAFMEGVSVKNSRTEKLSRLNMITLARIWHFINDPRNKGVVMANFYPYININKANEMYYAPDGVIQTLEDSGLFSKAEMTNIKNLNERIKTIRKDSQRKHISKSEFFTRFFESDDNLHVKIVTIPVISFSFTDFLVMFEEAKKLPVQREYFDIPLYNKAKLYTMLRTEGINIREKSSILSDSKIILRKQIIEGVGIPHSKTLNRLKESGFFTAKEIALIEGYKDHVKIEVFDDEVEEQVKPVAPKKRAPRKPKEKETFFSKLKKKLLDWL